MPKTTLYIVLCCIVYTVLTGCGTKGPLYIPEQRYPQNEDAQKLPQPPTTEAPAASKPN